MSFKPQYIAAYNSGLEKNKKPFLLIDTAFQTLNNAYVFRDRVRKREGLKLVGRLRRSFTAQAVGNVTIGLGQSTFNLYTLLGITETNPDIEQGNFTQITLALGAPINQTWIDNTGTSILTGIDGVNITSAVINYVTGIVTVQSTVNYGATPLTVTLAYHPALPVMGILQREVASQNNEQTILFDTKYAYIFTNQIFQEFLVGTTWSGTDIDFFGNANWRGVNPGDRIFFTSNFVNTASNPIRYTDGASWSTFQPILSQTGGVATTIYLTQARILIPYYGRMLALNVWQTGANPDGSVNYSNTTNIFNRCLFSQIGAPTDPTAWRYDQFGKGGYVDAPVQETIVSAIFYKNVLIVQFEKSTWVLRYQGEYGLPFIWERISSDFGAFSTFSQILFDQFVLALSDRAIVASSGNNVERIDLQIPDFIFGVKNSDNARQRSQGIRHFQKELVYWSYCDSQLDRKFPNYSLVYNYRNNTYAIFRNNVTAFGYLGSPSGISWDSLDVTWDDQVLWDTFIQEEYQDVISGNQQGYIHFYSDPNSETVFDSQVPAFDQESLYISAIDRSGTLVTLTVNNHNLETGEIIYITGLVFANPSTGAYISNSFNNNFFQVARVDDNTIQLYQWNFDTQQYAYDFTYTPVNGTGTYMGGGQITLFPLLDIITKDFNPFTSAGLQCKFGHLDFLIDATENANISVNLYRNSSLATSANILVGQKNTTTALTATGDIVAATNSTNCQITTRLPHGLVTGDTVLIDDVLGMTDLNGFTYVITIVDTTNFLLNIDSSGFGVYVSGGTYIQRNYPFYTQGSNYAWHRFYAGTNGSFFSVELTYDDNLMNTFDTHTQDFELNAMRIWTKSGGLGVY